MSTPFPECEPVSIRQGSTGVVVLHGFTGSPFEMRGIAGRLTDAGYSVEVPLLPGHGTRIGDLFDKTWNDFRSVALESYENLASDCDRTLVIGLSMGGTLAADIASLRPPSLRGAVFINPLMEPPDAGFLDLLDTLAANGMKTVPGNPDRVDPEHRNPWSYDGMPTASLRSVLAALGDLAGRLDGLDIPALIFTSPADAVVAPSSSDFLATRLAGEVERVVLEKSDHTATVGVEAPMIEDRILEFATRVAER